MSRAQLAISVVVLAAWMPAMGQTVPSTSPGTGGTAPAEPAASVPPAPVSAAADAPAKSRETPRKQLTPSFELSGGTTGEGTLSLGVDLLVRLKKDKSELHIKAALETSSHDGVSTLFDSSAATLIGERSYGGAFTLNYVELVNDGSKLEYLEPAERRDLVFLCTLDPRWNPALKDASGKRVSDVLNGVSGTGGMNLTNLDYGQFCRAAQVRMSALQDERLLPVPRQQFSLGLSVGRDELEQLSPTESEMVFTSTTRARPRFGITGSYAYFHQRSRFLLEASAGIKRLYEPSTTRAQWCTPAGTVADDDGGQTALSSCEDLPLGDPTRMTKVSAALYAGRLSSNRTWRIAAGPTAKFGFGGDEMTYELGLDVPFYFIRSTVDFSGVVRVAPSLLWTRDAAGETDRKLVLTISLLGSRTLLDTAFQ